MASKQSKCVRQGVSKLQSADRELKKNRVDKSNGVSEARPRSLPRDIRSKASNASKAPNAGSRHQAGHNKLRSVITMGSPPKTAPGLNNLSNETVSVNGQVEADVVFPGHNATSLPPGPHSSMPHLNMDGMPTEVLQMIWGEVINAPACHTFRIKAVNHPKVRTKWAVELWVKDGPDTSAYQRWKELLLGLKNIGFHMAFRHFVKHVQPIDLKLFNERHKVCSTTAAIDEAHDLVILEMDRGQALPWFQHADSYSSSMDGELVRERMRHFRRVAIHYKSGQLGFAGGAAFLCLCERTIQPHGDYNACPLTLACFLDLFQSLEQFYFVVDAKLVWHKKFASQYRDEVTKDSLRVRIDAPGGAQAVGKQYTLSRFFDTTYEYLQQAPYRYLEVMGRAGSADTFKARNEKPPSPWIGPGSAQQCLVETQQFYKSQKGNERFRQDLVKRENVRFGVLITYPLQDPGKKGST